MLSVIDRIMANSGMANRVRDERVALGWAQQELASRAGLSRAEVSAIETGRVVPSTAAALSLASVLGCTVESLFRLAGDSAAEGAWAWGPCLESRYWLAELGGRVWRYPVEATATGAVAHDGVWRGESGSAAGAGVADPRRTLVLAGCDPAMGLLAAVLARVGIRSLCLMRSSGRALDLLREGRVHVAGLHLGDGVAGNDAVIATRLGPGYRRVHVARWREGLALAPGLGHATIPAAVGGRLRWVGREEGSGAKRCQDLILRDHQIGRRDEWDDPFEEAGLHIASDHRAVVETIRTGWAQAGVCVEIAAAEAGLDFLAAREEDYDLCFSRAFEGDPRLVALLDAVRTREYARLLSELPGYDAKRTGELS
jgi:molybdate-binding protein/transcriptional regulator with XRE-family HTH domain